MQEPQPDAHMIDTPSRRYDRKLQPPVGGGALPLMNRKQRRAEAKQRKMFKHPGMWAYANTGIDKNKPIRRQTNA